MHHHNTTNPLLFTFPHESHVLGGDAVVFPVQLYRGQVAVQSLDRRIARVSVACGGSLPVGSGWKLGAGSFARLWAFFAGLRADAWSHFSAVGIKCAERGGPLGEMGWVMVFSRTRKDPLESWTTWGGLWPVLFERLWPRCLDAPKTKNGLGY